MRLGFDCMYEVGKFDRILHEKHRHVVTDQVEVAFLGMKSDREAAHVPCRISRSTRTGHG